MFVGEAPGADEDARGLPFVGRAGQKLTDIIGAMGLGRDEVYICNILKCRPPNNRDPNTEEVQACTPFLIEQVRTIKPEAIVALGRPAAQFLLNTTAPIGRLRGRWHVFEGIPVMPTYHPAYLLRQYTKENRQRVWQDMQQVMTKLGL
jgi:DNA polymerase